MEDAESNVSMIQFLLKDRLLSPVDNMFKALYQLLDAIMIPTLESFRVEAINCPSMMTRCMSAKGLCSRLLFS